MSKYFVKKGIKTKMNPNKSSLETDNLYWETQYKDNTTAWDIGCISPPIQSYIDTIANKKARILIPGCGNSYEAEYLLQQGFTNCTLIDIAPTLVARLHDKFKNNANITLILGDFFEHQGEYDYIIEQTFFCALPQSMRPKYANKMETLLAPKGKLIGLLFDRNFDQSPPYDGNKQEYTLLFQEKFTVLMMEEATNSILPRLKSELFIELQKKIK
jgi:SAM-dependent methyltransferase